jgi:hypothetical protein
VKGYVGFIPALKGGAFSLDFRKGATNITVTISQLMQTTILFGDDKNDKCELPLRMYEMGQAGSAD